MTILTPADIARELGVTEPQVKRWLVRGVLPGRKVGGKWH